MTLLPRHISDTLSMGCVTIVFVIVMMTVPAQAQTRARTTAPPSSADPAALSLVPLESGGPSYLDQVIEPDDYKVGPGDILFVNIWSARPEQYEVEITPEAAFIIPGVGELR